MRTECVLRPSRRLYDYGIPLTADMYMFGDFDYQTGVRYMSDWHESKKPLPDVFLCANDNIAAGLCATAEVLGYKVPQDFKVTGFDNLDKAAYFNPQITTVDHNRGNIGRNALRYLRRFGMARAMLLINTLILSLSRLRAADALIPAEWIIVIT